MRVAPVQAGVTAYFGQTRSGKTTLLRRELEAVRGRRAVIFDPRGSDSLNGLREIGSREGARRYFGAARGPGVAVVRFSRVDDYVWLARTVYYWRSCVWVLDDAAAQLEHREIAEVAIEAARAGRHFGRRGQERTGYGVELWVSAHRPIDIPPGVRAQVERIRSFRQTSPDDLKRLRDWTTPEFAEAVRCLEGHQHVSWPEGHNVNG